MNANNFAEIEQLVARERLFRARNNSAIRDCYFPDATVATSWQKGNLDTFLGAKPTEVKPGTPVVGTPSVPVIHQNGKRAYVELPTTTRMFYAVNGVAAEITSFRRLIYRVEDRGDGEWRIASMISINENDELRPVNPNADLHIKDEELKNLRPSYRWLTYTRRKAGGQISDDLLGTDRPEDVKRVYAEAEAWLNEAK